MSQIKATTLPSLSGSMTFPTDTVVDGSAKAWVNFNGTGTVAIRRAFNVSSITDNAVGDYTVNFTAALADGNYSAVGSSSRFTQVQAVHTASQLNVATQNIAGSSSDEANIQIIVLS